MDEVYEILKDILPNIKSPIVFELGANIGQDTVELLKLCQDGVSFFAVEPDPRCIAYMKEQGLDKKVNLIEAAVGKEDGEAILYQFSGKENEDDLLSTGPTSICKPRLHDELRPWLKYQSNYTAKVISLDIFCKDNGISHIDFIWADIQAGEYNMILGAQDILTRTRYAYLEHMDKEMYHNQKPLAEMLKVMPGEWEVVEWYPQNVLLKNLEYNNV